MRGTPRAGLSLVEVLVAITMLAIIGASIVAFLPTIVEVNRDASTEQEVTAASKLFFESLSGLPFPTALIDGTYGAGEMVAGSTTTVPRSCQASVSQPLPDLPIKRVVLRCDGTVDQILDLAEASR